MRRRALTMAAATLAGLVTGAIASSSDVAARSVAPTGRTTIQRSVCGGVQHHARRCTARVVTTTDGTPLAVTPHATQAVNGQRTAQVVSPTSAADLASAYNLPIGSAGSQTTIALVDAFGDSDVVAKMARFRADSALPACNGCLRIVDQNGGPALPPQPAFGDANFGWVTETDLDLQAASAACPLCHLLLVEAATGTDVDVLPAISTAEASAQVISLSFGGPEDPIANAQYDQVLNHAGTSVVASTGDTGYGVELPASSPYATAVGGTSLTRSGSGYSESAWSGAGSGCSAYETKPAWQHDTGCARRSLADVAADADPNTGLPVLTTLLDPTTHTLTEGYEIVGGTSLAAPLVAGAVALSGPGSGAPGAARFYNGSTGTTDVTSGSNGCPAGLPGTSLYLCTAGAGYDGPTGMGTPHLAGNTSSLFSGAYALGGYGDLRSVQGSGAASIGSGWPGWDITRGFALMADGRSGYVLDGFGGLHQFGAAPALAPGGYWPGWDIARDIVVRPQGDGGYVMDGWGGVHPFGSAPPLQGTPYWPGWDIAKRMALAPDGRSGYVLDGWGGIHPFGAGVPAQATGVAYWPGWNIARSIVLRADGQSGYTLDGWGGIHPFNGAPAVGLSAYWPGWDIARSVALLPGAGSPAGYTLDGWGGVHPFGGAPALGVTGYTPGRDLAHVLAIR